MCKGYRSFNQCALPIQVLFSIATLSPNHSGRCSSLHMTQDGVCVTGHILSLETGFQIVLGTFHSVPKEKPWWG